MANKSNKLNKLNSFNETPLNQEFAGDVALVVGGSSGIGLYSAVLLAKRGARVAIFADRGVAEAVAFGQQQGVELLGLTGDASISTEVQNAVMQTQKQLGGLHIAVHTAAIHPYGNAVDTTEEIWDRVMRINLKSVFLTAHYVIPVMKQHGRGAIVNLASGQATACQPDVSAYATSKAAILNFTRSLAVDFSRDGIRANIVSPGPIRTPLLDLSVQKFGGGRPENEVFAEWGSKLPMGRIGLPEEVAEVVAFAASPRAAFCTGSEFVVDGGLLAKLGV